MVIDHPYQPGGPFGRCAEPGCNRKKASHKAAPGVDNTLITGSWPPPAGPRPDPPPPSHTLGPNWKPTFETKIEDAGYVEPTAKELLPIYFRRRIGMGKPGEEVKITWPAGWPLPIVGQIIRVNGPDARVREVIFDLDRGRMILACD